MLFAWIQAHLPESLGALAAVVLLVYVLALRRSAVASPALPVLKTPAPAPKPKDDAKEQPEAPKAPVSDVHIHTAAPRPAAEPTEPHEVATQAVYAAKEALGVADEASKSTVAHVQEGAKALTDSAKKLLEIVPHAIEAAKAALVKKADATPFRSLLKDEQGQRRAEDQPNTFTRRATDAQPKKD